MPPPSSLAIKTSSVQRLVKEEASYHRETTQTKAKLEQLESQPDPDEYEVKQLKKVLEETILMAPAVRKRLRAALETLEDELENAPESEPTQSKEKAEKAIQDAKAVLAQHPDENDG